MSMRIEGGNSAPVESRSEDKPEVQQHDDSADRAAQEAAERAAEEARRAAEEARRQAEEAERQAEEAERNARAAQEQRSGRKDPLKEQAAQMAALKAQEAASRAELLETRAQSLETAAQLVSTAQSGEPRESVRNDARAKGWFQDGLELGKGLRRAGGVDLSGGSPLRAMSSGAGELAAGAAGAVGAAAGAGALVAAAAAAVSGASRVPSRVPTLEEAGQEIADKTRLGEPARMDLSLAAQLGGMRAAGPFKGASVDGVPVFFKNYTVPGRDPTRPDAQVYATLQRDAQGKDDWRTFEVAGSFCHAYNEMIPGRAGTNSPLGLPESGREVMKDGPYAGKPFQNFQNGSLVELEPGVVQRLDKQGKAVGEAWKDPKPVDLARDVPLPKPGQEATSVGGVVGPSGVNRVSGPDLDAADIRRIIGNAEKARGADFSPLNDGDMPEYIVAVAHETGVPVWLLLAQAGNETSFGSGTRDGYQPPPSIDNATVSDGQRLYDANNRAVGSGNAHNLFNIRPGSEWKGKHIDLGGSGTFRAYDSFKESVRDYANLMASSYKGLTTEQLVNKYYPKGDGDNDPATYISNMIGFARANGINLSADSVPIGPQARPTNITHAAPQSGASGVGSAQAVAGSNYAIPGAEQAIEFAMHPPPNQMKGSGGSWHYWCLGLVNTAYRQAGRPLDNLSKDTAHESYLAYKEQGQIRQDWPPPRGAIVFYDWHSDGENIGHIGISLGNGKHVNTATSGDPTQVTDIRTPSYLGWAYPTKQDAANADAAARNGSGGGGSAGDVGAALAGIGNVAAGAVNAAADTARAISEDPVLSAVLSEPVETSDAQRIVEDLYGKLLGREADGEGLAYHTGKAREMLEAGKSPRQVRDAVALKIADSEEYKQRASGAEAPGVEGRNLRPLKQTGVSSTATTVRTRPSPLDPNNPQVQAADSSFFSLVTSNKPASEFVAALDKNPDADFRARFIERMATYSPGGNVQRGYQLRHAVDSVFGEPAKATPSQQGSFKNAVRAAIAQGSFTLQDLRDMAATSTSESRTRQSMESFGAFFGTKVGPVNLEGFELAKTELQGAQAVLDKANRDVAAKEQELAATLANIHQGMTQDQVASFMEAFRKDNQPIYDARRSAEDAYATTLSRHEGTLAEAAKYNGPAATDLYVRAQAQLAQSKDNAKALQVVENFRKSMRDPALRQALSFERAPDYYEQVLGPAMAGAVSEKMARGASRTEAAEFINAIVKELPTQDGVKNSFDTYKNAKDLTGVIDKFAKSEDYAIVQELTEGVKTPFGKFLATAGVTLALWSAATSASKADALGFIKNAMDTAKGGTEIIGGVAGAFAAQAGGYASELTSEVAGKLAPVLGVVSGTASFAGHLDKLTKEGGNPGLYLATAGDVLGAAGNVMLLFPPTALGGAFLSGLGGLMSAVGDIWANGFSADKAREAAQQKLRDDQMKYLKLAGVTYPEGVIAAAHNPQLVQGLEGLGISLEEQQRLAAQNPGFLARGIGGIDTTARRMSTIVQLKSAFKLSSQQLVELFDTAAKESGNASGLMKLMSYYQEGAPRTGGSEFRQYWLKQLRDSGFESTASYLSAHQPSSGGGGGGRPSVPQTR